MRHRHRSESGAALIEFAIALPILILLVLGIIDIGRLLYTQITLHEAVQEGTLYASTHPADPAGSRNRVIESVDNPSIDLSEVTVDCPFTDSVRVRIEHDLDLLTPILGGGSVTLDAQAVGGVFSSSSCVASP